MALTTTQLDAIARQVYRQFPELKGERPAVRTRDQSPAASAKRLGAGGDERYELTFKGRARTVDGRALIRIVRVVADARGRILKLSTSK